MRSSYFVSFFYRNANEENSLMFFPGFESRLKVNANKENCSIVVKMSIEEGYIEYGNIKNCNIEFKVK